MRTAFERVMGAGQRFRVGRLYSRTVTPGLARLVAELSGARERARNAPSPSATQWRGQAICWPPWPTP